MATDLRDLLPGLTELGDPTRATDLARVADRIGLSPGRAQRVVALLVGESPKRFDLRVRLDQAAVLLAATDARVIDIAMACGFENHETLTRAFRRRFDEAPIEWRRRLRASRGDADLDPGQPPLVRTISPSITLYRRTLAQPPSGKDRPMPYEISTRTVEAVPILYQSRRVDRDAVADALAEVLPAVFTHVMEHGLPMAGPPIVRMVEVTPAFLTLEGGIPLAEAADEPPADTGIQAGWLHAGTVATTIHVGPYDTLGEAHVAIERWIDAEGAKVAGAPWEVYLTDPGEVPDPADWQTEVLWPINP